MKAFWKTKCHPITGFINDKTLDRQFLRNKNNRTEKHFVNKTELL